MTAGAQHEGVPYRPGIISIIKRQGQCISDLLSQPHRQHFRDQADLCAVLIFLFCDIAPLCDLRFPVIEIHEQLRPVRGLDRDRAHAVILVTAERKPALPSLSLIKSIRHLIIPAVLFRDGVIHRLHVDRVLSGCDP